MRLKTGVKLKLLSPQICLANQVVESIYARHEAECTITSANDSIHSASSFHYKGTALDYRTRDFLGNKQELLGEIKEALGPEFDVLLEDEDGPNEHIHIEWDPKS